MNYKYYSILCFLVFILFNTKGQNTENSNANQNLLYELYLIGDAGKYYETGHNPLFPHLKQQLSNASASSTLMFLGDNIYPKGLPSKSHPHYKEAEKSLLTQLEITKDFKGNKIFIAGNHDWQKGKKNGWTHVINQEKYVESYGDSTALFLPDNGCPGPVEISLNNETTLIILDTQWLLHPWDKPGMEDDCEYSSYEAIVIQVEDIIRRNKGKKIVLAGHHPLFSYGIHGGVTSFKEHMFPLTSKVKSLYIPLPVIGSLYPLYRKWIGNIQDIKHPKYKAIKNIMTDLFRLHPNLIHVSGHEHSMQYIAVNDVHYIVSGAGSKSTNVKKKGHAVYADNRMGFSKIAFYNNGDVRLEIWQLDENNQLTKNFETLLFNQTYQGEQTIALDSLNYSDSIVTVNASTRYETKRPGLYGQNYRDIWKQKIQVPVFDIGTEKGGLKILKRGGGQQTRSLRLEAKNGTQYVLRSVEKYAEKAVPAALRGTIFADIIQDQISASHPYGAFVIPKMAKAAGIYHTNPKLVFLPDDPRFGPYRRVFANGLFLFEERPANDLSQFDNFGNTKKAVNTLKVIEKLRDDNDNMVDQQWTLRSRLFDMVIGDWDRHDDQWRWASFKKGKGKIYRPIPRDRDQAFFINQGLFMGVAKKKWALPKIQGFDHKYSYVPGFNFNARYFDRDFLNEMDKEDWLAMADTISNSLNDKTIEEALKTWPDQVYELKGKEIEEKLKSNRDNLREYALEQYLFLSKAVNIEGSDKHEFFRVERINAEKTRVRMYKKTKNGPKEKKLYDRTFNTSETKEIRLYGLGGNDLFKLEGNVASGPLIRVIGGDGKDEITDQSNVKGASRKTKIYDNLEGNTITTGKEGKNLTSNDEGINNYNRKEFAYDKLTPLIIAKINRDDGLFLGGGFIYTKHGWRKEPYKANHFLLGNYAINTRSFNLNYHGTMIGAIGKWDLLFNVDLYSPNYATNFFGLGNETEFDEDADDTFNVPRAIDYYRIRYNHFNNEILLRRKIGEKAHFAIGHHWQMFKVENDYDGEDRVFLPEGNGDTGNPFFDWRGYEGGILQFSLDTRDNRNLPSRGVVFNTEFRGYAGINRNSNNFGSIQGEYAMYFSFRLPAEITLATRVGAGHTFGDFEFYQAQQLGGLSNLRGYRKTRFYGDSKAYQNTELRIKLATISNPVVPFSIGLNAFNDIGRVWLKGENSNDIHHGYGGGIWIAPLNTSVIALELARSEEELGFYFRFGYLF